MKRALLIVCLACALGSVVLWATGWGHIASIRWTDRPRWDISIGWTGQWANIYWGRRTQGKSEWDISRYPSIEPIQAPWRGFACYIGLCDSGLYQVNITLPWWFIVLAFAAFPAWKAWRRWRKPKPGPGFEPVIA